MNESKTSLNVKNISHPDLLNHIVYAPALDERFKTFYEEIVRRSKIHLLVGVLKNKRPVHVLDVGGGTGNVGKELVAEFGGKIKYTNLDCDSFALDLSPGKKVCSDFYFYEPRPVFDYTFMVNTGQDPQYLESKDGRKYSLGVEFESEVEKMALYTALKSLRKQGTLMIALFDPTPVEQGGNYLREAEALYSSFPHLEIEESGRLTVNREAIDLYRSIDAEERKKRQGHIKRWKNPGDELIASAAFPAKCDPIFIRIRKKQEFSPEFQSYLESHYKRDYAFALFFLLSAQHAADERKLGCRVPGMTKEFYDRFKKLHQLAMERGIKIQEALSNA